MAEIDTRPLESVQSALNLFEQRSDHSMFSSPDRNEQEIDVVAKELATCKLQLEAKESENKQANMKLEALRKTMQDLSEKYDQACLDAHRRITELEADNVAITTRQSQAAAECEALRDELDVAVGELDAVRRANAYVLGEVESMETRRILERESARDGLMRVLELNEAVLDSAVAAIKAEEERSVYFQEVTLQMFSSDKNLEAIRKHKEAMEGMEGELLAKTVEVECLRSELLQLKELYVSSSERVMVPASATVQHADGEAVANPADAVLSCDDDHVDVNAGKSDNGKGSQEPGGEVADLVNGCPEVAEAYFDSELPREECRNIQSGDGNTNVATSADAVEVRAGQRRRVRFMPESPMEDFKSVNSECCKFMDAGIGMSESQAATRGSEPEAAGAGFVSEIVEVNSKEADGDGELYTKDQVVDVDRLGDGYVLVAKKADGGALKDEKLDAAQAEISDLRFSLEEAVRRAELAEEAKAALERELREEIQTKQRTPRQRAPGEDGRLRRVESTPAAPSWRRPTPSQAPAGGKKGGGRPPASPGCLTLGKALNMKYK
ncbi:neurofilament medium polypeptide-like [Hordeum vulgare]|nr:neurofilament medium polypeptide-like [Hordeum vulgare]